MNYPLIGRRVRVRFHLVRRYVKHAFHHLRHSDHKRVGKVATASHLAYYGLVFVESHGMYGKAALVCGIILFIEVIIGGPHDE